MDSRVFKKHLWDVAWNNGQPQRSKHAAALVSDKAIIATGWNKDKTHPLQQRFAKHEEAVQLHAEIDVIVNFIRYNKMSDLSLCDLYVARVKLYEDGKRKIKMWGNSEPCIGCRSAIEAFNIRSVYYTLDSSENDLLVEEWHRD